MNDKKRRFAPDEIIVPANDGVLLSMSLAAFGAVVRLSARAWQSDGCLLPDDDTKLARLAGATPEEWAAVKDEVRQILTPAGDGKVVIEQSRARWEVARDDTFRRMRAGKAGAAIRWHRDRNAIASNPASIAGENAIASSPRVIRFASPSKISSNGKNNNAREEYVASASDVERVFAYFRERLGHSARTLLTEARSKAIRARLREEADAGGDPVLGLMAAVDGARVDPWFNGTDPKLGGRRLWDFDNVFVNKGRGRIEKLQASARRYSEPVEVAPGLRVAADGTGTVFPAAGERGTVGQRMARNAQIADAMLRAKRGDRALPGGDE